MPFRWHPLANSPIEVAIILSDVWSENVSVRVIVWSTALIFDPFSHMSFHNKSWLCSLSAQSVIGETQAAEILE